MPFTARPQIGPDLEFSTRLREYVHRVSVAIGVGWESCAVDTSSPATGYIAVDWRLPGHADRDVAVLWDETQGWSVAIETHSGEDLIVVALLGGSLTPDPSAVADFLADVRGGTLAAPGAPVVPLPRPDLTASLDRHAAAPLLS
ncbi:DUF6292 family protein [Amycolatopsis sp. CA-230715]|uniref:DUF6292 family protein n=1 Tax=Amycolatopsis sp. CA-230715 TaxID=2745196 RepID=UPI001C3396AC|nr:DUF6292 family protein [Amycolatopsis sp. CA-230715]QWF77768.1 hypothetical protein HUW46_01160 [Amycolatopsis sp. CA-230715]